MPHSLCLHLPYRNHSCVPTRTCVMFPLHAVFFLSHTDPKCNQIISKSYSNYQMKQNLRPYLSKFCMVLFKFIQLSPAWWSGRWSLLSHFSRLSLGWLHVEPTNPDVLRVFHRAYQVSLSQTVNGIMFWRDDWELLTWGKVNGIVSEVSTVVPSKHVK